MEIPSFYINNSGWKTIKELKEQFNILGAGLESGGD